MSAYVAHRIISGGTSIFLPDKSTDHNIGMQILELPLEICFEWMNLLIITSEFINPFAFQSHIFFQHKTLCIFYKQFVCMVYCCSSVVCTYVVLYCCTAFHSIRLLPRQVGVPIFLVHKGSLAELSRYWVQLVYALLTYTYTACSPYHSNN